MGTSSRILRSKADPSWEAKAPARDLTRARLREQGKSLRESCPRGAHAAWRPADDRADPVHLLEESNVGRMPELVPIRNARMLKSPFAWYRGSAGGMAADLSRTPTTGLRVQACGDGHVGNFGAFATPERRVIFDINDFDETLPAPWEWDVKRLAASFVLASRENGFREDAARDAALACARSYRERMAEFSAMPALDVWYAAIDVEQLIAMTRDEEARKRARKRLERARERSIRDHEHPEMALTEGLEPTIRDNPPLIFHWREEGHKDVMERVSKAFVAYRETLPEHRRVLLDRFQLRDVAIKVVGVGSVGTLCAVLLLTADDADPLFLQVKEAGPSVLEPYAGPSLHPNHGQRVVVGCQLMQSASDLFLGWSEGISGRHFYVRQLRDMKIKMRVECYPPGVMRQYAQICGWCLARAHARSGEPAAISGYLGASDAFDEAVADFSVAYADQTERDHETLRQAVLAGRIPVAEGPL